MSETARDPAQGSIDQQRQDANTLQGQEGYGVEYDSARFQDDGALGAPGESRTGSYEADNTGGYGAGSSGPPDPEAQQGQGGQ